MHARKTKILGFGGQIGSGKSTISKLLADKLSWKRAGFGDFLRAQALSRGLDSSDRVVLQNLGREFIQKGWGSFCSQVLVAASWIPGENMVVDGIRHVDAIETLKEITQPSDVKLVYITTPEGTRTQRVVTRGREKSLAAEYHPVELEVQTALPARADLLIDNTLSQVETIEKITSALGSWIADG